MAVMSSNVRRPRLCEPGAAQALFELAVEPRFIGTATALLVCCDSTSRPLHHVHLLNCTLDSPATDLTAILDALIDRVLDGDPTQIGGVALALTRPGGDQIQPSDRTWFRAFFRLCHLRGLAAHGVYVVTRSGARVVTVDDAA